MKIVIFGLSISSSWGNGHATLWRGLCRALIAQKHQIHFFEKDVPYYAANRDFTEIPGGHLHLYPSWEAVRPDAQKMLRDADVGIVTSYCPDGIAATELVASSNVLSCFYDLDAPVTLHRLRNGEQVEYIGSRGLRDFELVLSYTGGQALQGLRELLGAKRTYPLYGFVDPEQHHPAAPVNKYQADLSYLGTYAEDRQRALEELFVAPARCMPDRRFLIGGAMYPQSFPWTENIYFVRHVPPSEHPAFFSSSRLTLNITRAAMAELGYCPSGRLFEAAACDAPILSDWWTGLDQFFEPGSEILVASNSGEAREAIGISDRERLAMARRARERVLASHTAAKRAEQLVELIGAMVEA